MNLKQYHRCRMDFSVKAAGFAGLFTGAYLFLLCVYFFFLRDLSSIKAGEAVFGLILPMLLCILFIVLLRFVKLNAPGLFAIIGAAFCLLLMINTFSTGNLLHGVLGAVWYILCGLGLIISAGGYLPSTAFASAMFGIGLALRVVLFDLRLRGITNWVYEFALLMLIAALTCLPLCIVPAKPRK